jgi:hypothetical protein
MGTTTASVNRYFVVAEKAVADNTPATATSKGRWIR